MMRLKCKGKYMVALTKPYFAGRKKQKKAQRARDIVDAQLRDYCERAKRELELQTGIQAQIQIPLTEPKKTQTQTISQSSLGAKGDSMVPLNDTLLKQTKTLKF